MICALETPLKHFVCTFSLNSHLNLILADKLSAWVHFVDGEVKLPGFNAMLGFECVLQISCVRNLIPKFIC